VFEADESTWPIVAVKWRGHATDSDIVSFLALLDGWLARNQRFGLLFDSLGAVGTMSSGQRDQVMQHMKSTSDVTGRLLVQAIVHESPLHRALYAAMSFAFPLPFPSKTFPHAEPARLWLADKLSSVR
jgi:hypothetical protein